MLMSTPVPYSYGCRNLQFTIYNQFSMNHCNIISFNENSRFANTGGKLEIENYIKGISLDLNVLLMATGQTIFVQL